MKATIRLSIELARLNSWKNFVVKSSLTPYILMMMLLKVNWGRDSEITSKKEIFLVSFSSPDGKLGMSCPFIRADQHLTMCLHNIPLQQQILVITLKLFQYLHLPKSWRIYQCLWPFQSFHKFHVKWSCPIWR